jgi:hypothetical protein
VFQPRDDEQDNKSDTGQCLQDLLAPLPFGTGTGPEPAPDEVRIGFKKIMRDENNR